LGIGDWGLGVEKVYYTSFLLSCLLPPAFGAMLRGNGTL